MNEKEQDKIDIFNYKKIYLDFIYQEMKIFQKMI